MDTAFLKFWGDFLAQAADGTRGWADLARWTNGDFRGAPDMTALFRSAYGLQHGGGDPWQTEAWCDAAARFHASWDQFLEGFDVVSRQRYEAVRQEKIALEKKAADQDRLIAQLRLELAQSSLESGRVVDGFRHLTQLQEAQFRQVSDSLQRFFHPQAAKNPHS